MRAGCTIAVAPLPSWVALSTEALPRDPVRSRAENFTSRPLAAVFPEANLRLREALPGSALQESLA